MTILWTMSELIRKPRVLGKVQAGIRAVAGGNVNGRVLSEDVSKLSYLGMVVKETMRLHPPAPFLLPRECRETCRVMGYDVPKGTKVVVNVWAMGRDEAIWSEPEKFMPERFLGRAVDYRGGDFELIPFGAGRRMCPGMPLAIRMVHLVLGSLLPRFKWRLPTEVERSGIDMSEKFGVTLTKAVPLRAIATPKLVDDNR